MLNLDINFCTQSQFMMSNLKDYSEGALNANGSTDIQNKHPLVIVLILSLLVIKIK